MTLKCLKKCTFIWFLSSFIQLNSTQELLENSAEFMQECLQDLKISELLRFKKSLDNMVAASQLLPIDGDVVESKMQIFNESVQCAEQEGGTCDAPKALALTEQRSRGHFEYNPWQPEEKTSKLQTLFQISITALSFLSFGGYLLCLIVQAIKSKGTTYFHPVATATTTTPSGNVKRIKIYRRNRRWTMKQQPTSADIYQIWRQFDAKTHNKINNNYLV